MIYVVQCQNLELAVCVLSKNRTLWDVVYDRRILHSAHQVTAHRSLVSGLYGTVK